MQAQLLTFSNQAEEEEVVPYLDMVEMEGLIIIIMDMMDGLAPEAAAEKAEQMLEMAEKVEMEPFGLFDKISQTNLSNLKKYLPKRLLTHHSAAFVRAFLIPIYRKSSFYQNLLFYPK